MKFGRKFVTLKMIKYWIGVDSKGDLSCQEMKTD